MRALDRATVAEHVRELKKYRSKLLAEKVETAEEFEYYKSLGFFQGYFLSRPNVIKAQGLSTNRLAVPEKHSARFAVEMQPGRRSEHQLYDPLTDVAGGSGQQSAESPDSARHGKASLSP